MSYEIPRGANSSNQNEQPGNPESSFLEEAINVVDMFDQANTGKVIESLGSRGLILKDAIEDLRAKLNSDQKRTILDSEQAN